MIQRLLRKRRFLDGIGILLVFSQQAVAVEADTQAGVNNVTHVISKTVIDDRMQPTVTAADPAMADLLKRFRQQPDDLSLLAEVNNYNPGLFHYIDERLADTEQPISIEEAGELVSLLSVMKYERALNTLIAIADRFNTDAEFSQQVLLILRDLPVTASVAGYINNVFKVNRNHPQLIRSALLYCAAVRHDACMRWAGYYRSPGIDPQLRFAGLLLAARLSQDDQITRWILAELRAEPAVPMYQQYYLLDALYANVSAEQFDQLLPNLNVAPVVVKEFQRILDFNQAAGEQKNNLAGFMLVSPHIDQQQNALKYFIDSQQIMTVWGRLDTRKRLMAVRLANTRGQTLWPVIEIEKPAVTETKVPWALYIAVGMLALLLHLWVRRNRSVRRMIV